MIGTFGEVVFETSAARIRTFDAFRRTGKARFARHAVMDRKPRLQFTGGDLDRIEFQMRFDVSLGVNPKEEIDKLREILAAGVERQLIIGGEPRGKFVLEELAESWTHVDNAGRLLVAAVDIKLQEYADGN